MTTEMTEKAIGWLQHLIASAERGTVTPLEVAVLNLAAAIADAVDIPTARAMYITIPVHTTDDDREWVNRIIFTDDND